MMNITYQPKQRQACRSQCSKPQYKSKWQIRESFNRDELGNYSAGVR